jgi:hypothetical protein
MECGRLTLAPYRDIDRRGGLIARATGRIILEIGLALVKLVRASEKPLVIDVPIGLADGPDQAVEHRIARRGDFASGGAGGRGASAVTAMPAM